MAHYYSADPDSAHAELEISFQYARDAGAPLRLLTDHGVFSRTRVDFGSSVLINAVALPDAGAALDLGCGYGPIGLALARCNPKLNWTLSDVNRRALHLAGQNAQRNNIPNVRIVESDGFSDIAESFDLIVTNPPIRIGKAALQSMWRDAHAHLNVDGKLFLVIQKKQGAPSAAQFLEALFGNVETVARKAGYHVLLCTRV